MTITYQLGIDTAGQLYIQCLDCGLLSFHPEDIRQKYCGNCHAFHGDKARWRDYQCSVTSDS